MNVTASCACLLVTHDLRLPHCWKDGSVDCKNTLRHRTSLSVFDFFKMKQRTIWYSFAHSHIRMCFTMSICLSHSTVVIDPSLGGITWIKSEHKNSWNFYSNLQPYFMLQVFESCWTWTFDLLVLMTYTYRGILGVCYHNKRSKHYVLLCKKDDDLQ